jgi:hypothetical protein
MQAIDIKRESSERQVPDNGTWADACDSIFGDLLRACHSRAPGMAVKFAA